ncbi:MAG TPA: multifunctional oxoglutarate decarboxylase/oxoglutarate dehydrogenase thiamine pyrophosphate-binding subunit/dihydrolipoyllysine-residue succinyltransferase subunit [Candidatus Acidoferrales bacterium]|nr:multifunctional oxoglutarate decarboxylase/oxoglutarate dehydrogenase thiamine pyrophosphate-binding subunit/dihydrolipoyllysine-residue succinyltransferase subunit [Candidatus Acidoferrales bacterium]
MSAKSGINSWLEDELYQQYLRDRSTVDESWKEEFGNGGTTAPAVSSAPAAPAATGQAGNPPHEWQPLRGAAGRIAENMAASVTIPLATSQRTIAVKVMDENRRIINQHRTLVGRSKVSYTHLLGWAVIRALEEQPGINHAYAEKDGQPYRVTHKEVNLGIAVDVAGKDGARSLMVPNIKNAGALNFQEYVSAFDDLVSRARAGKLTPADFQGTTISLTNPGTVGTMSSNPRLMVGQGAIIAAGAIDYPAEYQGAANETRALLGISKVMTLTCTYDHRIIQGAESGMFLGRVQALLDGNDGFYEEVFNHLRMPHQPVRWETDRNPALPGVNAARYAEIAKEAGIMQMINAYRVRGHLIADLDPLGAEPSYHAELDPETYGLTIWDLDREFLTGSLGEAIGEGAPKAVATLREILETLRQTYCGKIGCEYMNIQVPEQKRWLQHRMEPQANNWPLDRETRLRILESIVKGEEFEHFLHSRFVGQKRFALEGGETALAILNEILERAAAQNVHEVVMGMAHRGRLNVLANTVGKDVKQIFSEFEGEIDPGSTQGSGDVKYHLGATGVRRTASGREIVVSVSPNPSHLEAVDPVVEGIVRPKQDRLGDAARERVIPLLIHGDAAFAGQGVVAETLNLSQLDGYSTGGTIHLIINNQIGFTTLPDESRSTPYSTDVARGVQAPIFHVNGDDPEAAIRVVQIALDYRQKFKKDVVIDMICYRRHGHNEGDDPSYTQPILYRKIKDHPAVGALYEQRLIREGAITSEEAKAMRHGVAAALSAAYDAVQQRAERYELQELSAVQVDEIGSFCPRTSVNQQVLERVIRGTTHFPENFHLHPKLRGFVDKRREAIAKGGAIDWAFGEALAFGTLVLEGTAVRLSGQDSGRGTFSQRHLAFYDYETQKRYVPMQHISPDQARFDVFDSSLSEYAVLGFEFGYSVADPLTLLIWEAQFGDFANGAQIMIDQFISCCEQKWGQPSGLVMLLPHGFEGQGPEHSSARIERYLTLCAENNMQVCNVTTPAQYFHLLRRQMYGGSDRRGVRKPLVIFTPKSLLRHPKAVSTLHDFTSGGFQDVLSDSAAADPSRVTRVVFCSGKLYYDLLAARDERKADHVALIRMEQLYPFAAEQVRDILARYAVTAEVVWAQEEPRNMGAWHFVRDQFQPVLDASGRDARYVGRPESASPATGSGKRHQQEQAEIINDALTPGAISQTKRVRVVARRKRS